MTQAVIILVSCADDGEARRIARALVEQRLAACVHIRPHVAIYRWRGAIEEEAETGLTITTTAAARDAAVQCICRLHSYEVPAVFTLDAGGDAAMSRWLRAEVEAPDDGVGSLV